MPMVLINEGYSHSGSPILSIMGCKITLKTLGKNVNLRSPMSLKLVSCVVLLVELIVHQDKSQSVVCRCVHHPLSLFLVPGLCARAPSSPRTWRWARSRWAVWCTRPRCRRSLPTWRRHGPPPGPDQMESRDRSDPGQTTDRPYTDPGQILTDTEIPVTLGVRLETGVVVSRYHGRGRCIGSCDNSAVGLSTTLRVFY